MTIPPVLRRFIVILRQSARPVPWVRAAALAGVLATVVAIIVIVSADRPCRVHAALTVHTESDEEAAAATHLGALLSPRTVAAAEQAAPDVRAFVESQLRIRTEIGHGIATLDLAAITVHADRARRQLNALGKAYVKHHLATSRPASGEPPIRLHLRRRREALQTQRTAIDAEIERLAPLSRGKVIEERKRLSGLLADHRQQWRQSVDAHAAAVAALDALRSAPAPSGTVAPADLRRAEARDTALQQDTNALLDRLALAHDELAEAVAAVKPATAALVAALDTLKAELSQQHENQSDLNVAALLERMGLAVTDYRAAADEFARAWNIEAAGLSKPDAAAQANALLTRQAELERILRDFRFETDPIAENLRAQLEALVGEGKDRTQRIVIQNTLRSAVHGVRDAAARLGDAGSGAVTTDNFRLDGACRSAAGLARRIAERRKRIVAGLQEAADRDAADRHAAQTVEAGKLLAQRAEQRDAALERVLTTLQEILELDPPFVAVVRAQAQRKAVRQRATALADELRRLDEILALPWPGAATPDTVEYVAAVVEPVPATTGRLGAALAAFVITVVLSVAVAVALTAQRPSRPQDVETEPRRRVRRGLKDSPDPGDAVE